MRPVRETGIAGVFVRDGAEQNKPRVDFFFFPQGPVFFDQLHQLGLICIRTLRPGERFVVAIHDEDHIGRNMLQILGIVGEAFVAGFFVDHISREAHVAKADVQAFQLALQNGLNPGGMLHSVGETIAIQSDHVIGLKAKRLGGCRRPGRQQRGQNANDQQVRKMLFYHGTGDERHIPGFVEY